MAGNTRFVGFLMDNRIQLERWGTRAIVQLNAEAIEALRAACFSKLPKTPAQGSSDHLNDFKAKYDEGVGRVHVDLSPSAAAYLGDLLTSLAVSDAREIPWAAELRTAVHAHRDFHDVKDEPGVAT
jgi:hypothetical protein